MSIRPMAYAPACTFKAAISSASGSSSPSSDTGTPASKPTTTSRGAGADVERDTGDGIGDHRPRERGDQRVLPLVQRVRLDRLRDLLLREVVLAVDEQYLARAGGIATLERRLEIRLLADVDEHRDHLVEAVVLLQPRDRAARVEPARVGEHCRLAHVSPSR